MSLKSCALSSKRGRFEEDVKREVEFVRYLNEYNEAKKRRREHEPIKAEFSHLPHVVQPVSLVKRVMRRGLYGASKKRGAESVEVRLIMKF